MVDPAELGPPAWDFFHFIALTNPESMREFAPRWARSFPCATCAAYGAALVEVNPPPASIDEVWEWSVWIHNQVNRKLGKPIFTPKSKVSTEEMFYLVTIRGNHKLGTSSAKTFKPDAKDLKPGVERYFKLCERHKVLSRDIIQLQAFLPHVFYTKPPNVEPRFCSRCLVPNYVPPGTSSKGKPMFSSDYGSPPKPEPGPKPAQPKAKTKQKLATVPSDALLWTGFGGLVVAAGLCAGITVHSVAESKRRK